SSTDIREIMSGSKVNVRGGGGFGGGGRGGGGRRGGGGGGGGGDTISLTISGSPAELEKGFQLAYLLLTEPKIEPTAFEQFQTNGKTMLEEVTKNPMMYGGRMVNAATYPDTEPRTQPLTEEQIDHLTVDAAQAWLDKLLRESPIEVTIVGDLPREKAMELTAKYIGSLPTRERIAPTTFANLRQIERPKGPRVITKSIETQTPQAFVHCGFYGTDEKNIDDTRYLNMAARVLSTRMIKEVREDAQLVYSIGASSRAGSTYPGFGMFSASAPTDPAKAPALVEKLGSMYREFAQNGPTDDEMTVAKKQFANTLEEQMREPGFWSGRLSGMTFHGGCLDDIMTAPEAYQQMTKEQVRQTFAKYWSPENEVTVVVKPEEQPDATPGAKPEAATSPSSTAN
ncbi:MAG TPA: pitrilysin family protein, partial [Phycisphaerales bacterium]|nr:pitrilysin family protein [Phycisphaerales bacterium]